MNRFVLLLVTLCFISACATNKVVDLTQGNQQSTALIQSSPTVMFKYIDDEPANTGFVGQTHSYKVVAGQRTVMVEYSDLYEISVDEHDKVVSRPAKVTFTAQAGKSYQILNPKQDSLQQAKDFAEKPDFYVVNSKTGEKVEAKVELSRPRTFLTTLRSSVAPVYEFESDKVNSAPATASSEAALATAPSKLDLLQDVWKQASDEEKKIFLQWVERN